MWDYSQEGGGTLPQNRKTKRQTKILLLYNKEKTTSKANKRHSADYNSTKIQNNNKNKDKYNQNQYYNKNNIENVDFRDIGIYNENFIMSNHHYNKKIEKI